MSTEELIDLCEKKIALVRLWAIRYWGVYNYSMIASLLCSTVVLTLSGVLLSVAATSRDAVNIIILITGGFGFFAQLLGSVPRLKERSFRGQRLAAKLESALIRFKNGAIDKNALIDALNYFLEEAYNEEGP